MTPSNRNDLVREYFLGHLLMFKGEPLIRRLEGVSCTVGFRIENLGSSAEYLLRLSGGAIEAVEEGWDTPPEIVYGTSEETFFRIVGGWLRAERAFLTRKVSVGGQLLRGLKLAFLLQEFFDRFPYRPGEGETRYGEVRQEIEDPIRFPEGLTEEKIEIAGSGLSVKAVYREEGLVRDRVILAPPHPYLGGSSDNTLLLHLSRELALRGAFVVRFDYSDPKSAQSEVEDGVRSFWERSDAGVRMGVRDLQLVHEWLRTQNFARDSGITWIGYSYGAQVCLWAQEFGAPDRLVFISPVASQLGNEKSNCARPTLLIGATEDFATPLQEFRALEGKFPGQPLFKEIEGADHFYSGREDELTTMILDFLKQDSEKSSLAAAGFSR